AEVVTVDRAHRPIHFPEGPAQRRPARSAGGDERAVDVEQEEAHYGASRRRRPTIAGNTSTTASMSCPVVHRPSVKQSEASAATSSDPMARRMCDGWPVRVAQAEPGEAD